MARLAAVVEIAPERQQRQKERRYPEAENAGPRGNLRHCLVKIGHRRQRAITHQQHKNAMRGKMKDLVLEIMLKIESLLRRDEIEQEAYKEKGQAQEDEPIDLLPVASSEIDQGRQGEENQRNGEVTLQIVPVIIEREPERGPIIGPADGGVELRILRTTPTSLPKVDLIRLGSAFGYCCRLTE